MSSFKLTTHDNDSDFYPGKVKECVCGVYELSVYLASSEFISNEWETWRK